MPHVGGGSHGGGGGFHSSGSGSSSSAPRYDNHGNLHSKYYVRPGFYYGGIYIPYTSKNRKISALAPFFFIAIVGIVLAIIAIFIGTSGGKYDNEKLEDYALNQYSEVYDRKDSNYEKNILVTLVTYKNNKEYDYISIVGDYVNYAVDNCFGNQQTYFGYEVLTNITERYYENLYSNLSTCLTNILDKVGTNYVSGNTSESKIINKTNFGPINGENDLIAAEQAFFNKTGYRVSFLITDNKQVYKVDIEACVFTSLFSLGMFGIVIYGLKSRLKAVNEVEKAIKNHEAKKYFEGEDDFETYFKDHPLK